MIDLDRLQPAVRRLACAYLDAKFTVIEAGYADEIDRMDERNWDDVGEQTLLAEAAWVILNSGMRERIVRELFPRLANAFGDFQSARWIVERQHQCRQDALGIFNHPGKVDAIVEFARRTADLGAAEVVTRVRRDGVDFLMTFPYLGPATARHLGKNMGMDVAKPDRHLLRYAAAAGYSTPQQLCATLSEVTGDSIAVIDLVLWRHAVIASNGGAGHRWPRPDLRADAPG